MRIRPRLRAIWRAVRVLWAFLPFAITYLRDRRRYLLVGGTRSVSAARQRRRAERLLDTLIELGPTFIKLGQLLSTRPDILPPVYIEVLSTLQDDVPPAPWPEAESMLEAELGPVAERFDSFDTTPLSGASLGQVYRARVDGTDVAVKIRRPGVESLVEADLVVIRWILAIVLPFVDRARAFSLQTLADEFARTIREEMDYHHERAMLEEIRSNVGDDPAVEIPAVLGEHSGATVLTMEYLEGTKITDVEELDDRGIDRHRIAERLQRTYFTMIIRDGVFHADPHPGNIAVKDDGTIVFYDFGITGRVAPYIQDKIVEFYIGVVNEDIDAILDALIEVGTLSPEADRQVMSEVMEIAIEDARGGEVKQYRIQQIVQQIEDSIYEFPFRLPEDLALILRVATVVEGICVTLDPDYDFVEVASAYLTDHGYLEESVRKYLTSTRDDLRGVARSTVAIPPKLERTLDRVEHENFRVEANVIDEDRQLERLAKRLVLGMIAAGVIIATAVWYVAEAWVGVGLGLVALLVIGLLLVRSFRRRRGIRATPQFTRQNLRRRRDGDD